MVLLRQNNTEEFNSILANLNRELETESKLNLLSQAVHAEEFYKRVLNSAFSWKLENVNECSQNAEGIDLLDSKNHIIVQITITCTKSKIEQTLNKTVMKRYSEEGYTLKFAFIGKQDSSVKKKNYANKHQIRFDPTSDIILSDDLVRHFAHMDIDEQEAILHIAKQETGVEFMFTNKSVLDFFESSKKELGARYNPSLTVSTAEMDYCEPLINPAQIKASIASLSAKTIESLKRIDIATLPKPIDAIEDGVRFNIDTVLAFLTSVEIISEDPESITAENIDTALKCANSILYSENFTYGKTGKSDDAETVIREIQKQAAAFHHEIMDTCYDLLDSKFVIINGSGGIGKSHFIADLCAKANSSNTPALLFLGQNFTESEAPLQQMAHMIDSDLSEKGFLAEISRFAQTQSTRAIIAIDALNEGIGRKFWINHLHTLKEKIDNYDNLILVVSVRSPYEKDVIPESLHEFLDSSCINLTGFSYCDNAIEAFCSYYDIGVPAIPVLDDEFKNPLYLRLLCEAARAKGANTFDLRMSFSDAIDIIVANANKVLARENRLGFDHRINFVAAALEAIASDNSFIEGGWIKYKTAFDLVTKAVAGQIDKPGDLLGAICDEDLLRVQGSPEESYLSFAFERVGDFFAANEILRKAGANPERPFTDDVQTKLKDLIGLGLRSGVLEALAILLPERYGVELFESCNEDLRNEMAFCFIESIPWRRTRKLSEEAFLFIDQFILKDNELSVLFISRLLNVSLWSDSDINATYMHKLLYEMNPQIRDALWSWVTLRNQSIEDTIIWIWHNAKRIPQGSLMLAEILLTWCTATSGMQIRDTATKALSCCLIEDPASATRLIDAFFGCSDDYVIERLIAAIYGAATNSEICESWIASAYAIYEFTYGGNETYPNIMIRNYTDCLISYLVAYKAVNKNAFPNVLRAGNSTWYQKQITNLDIDRELFLTEKRYGEDSDESHNLWWIIHSMTTEYGRGTCRYGDFGRYVFGGYVRCWKNQFASDQDLSNLATWEVLQHRYVPELHCSFDRAVKYHERGRNCRFERLSKKYQRIETYRLLARLIDNYPPYREYKTYDQEYEDYRSRRLKAFNEAFRCAGGFPVDFSFEPELNPKEHISDIRRMPLESYEVFNELSFVRDIDPTYICPAASNTMRTEKTIAPDLSNLSGADCFNESKLKDVFDSVESVPRDNKSFFPLSLIVTKNEVSSETKEVHLNSSCGFVRIEDIDRFLEAYEGKTGDDVLSFDTYSVYAQEHCEGFGYQFYQALRNSELGEKEALASPASSEYIWEPPKDASLDGEVARFLAPAQDFIEYFSLTQLPVGVWIDKDGRVISFNESTSEGYQLLVDSSCLAEYLASKHLSLVKSRYFEISSFEECQRLWLVGFEGEEGKYERLIDKEQYKIEPDPFN